VPHSSKTRGGTPPTDRPLHPLHRTLVSDPQTHRPPGEEGRGGRRREEEGGRREQGGERREGGGREEGGREERYGWL